MIAAARSTINKLIKSASSHALRKVREVYNISAGTLREHTAIWPAKGNEIEAKFIVRGRKMRLTHFQPMPKYEGLFGSKNKLERFRRSSRGITVLIRRTGGRKIVLGSFYGRARGSAKIFIWKREGPGRYPIKPLFTVSPANMMEKEGEAVFEKLVQDEAGSTFNHELDFFLNKGGS